MEIMNIPVNSVAVGNRLRPVDPAYVDQLATSISERGIRTPIEVRTAGVADEYVLVFGAHRLAAAVKLELTTIPAVIFEGSDDEARLEEIDENLYRHELNAYDQAAFLAERREIYERINGKLKPGKAAKNPINRSVRAISFFDEITQKFGLSRAIIERAMTRWANIDPAVRAMLRGTEWAKKGANLEQIRKLQPDEQQQVVKMLLGEAPPKNVADAVKLVRGVQERSPDEKLYDALTALWDRVTPEVEERFRAYQASRKRAMKKGA